MKRISRFALMMLFSLFVLGSNRAFAGSGGSGNNQGGNEGGLINWIENLIKDIFDDGNNQGNNGNPGTTSGGGTAPIDGGISLLMIAGVGLGVKKMVKARQE